MDATGSATQTTDSLGTLSASTSSAPLIMNFANPRSPADAQDTQSLQARRKFGPIPEQVRSILFQYYHHETKWPKRAARLQLAAQIQAIPGWEHYTEQNVAWWFANTRRAEGCTDPKRKRRAERPTNSLDGGGLQQQSLGAMVKLVGRVLGRPWKSASEAEKTFTMLEVLLNDEPHPSPEFAAVWAARLGHGINAQKVLTYAAYRRKTLSRDVNLMDPASANPANCASPPPSQERDVPDSAISGGDHTPSHADMLALATKLHTALNEAPSIPMDQTPKTLSELSEWIRRQDSMSEFFRDINEGRYTRIGLLPVSPR